MLQKMHKSIKIPTAIRHGPIAFGGLDLYDMRTEIGTEGLKLLQDSPFADLATCKYIMINLRATQLEAGVDFCILVEEPSQPISYPTPTCISWAFLADHNLKITITDQPEIILKSANNAPIMQNSHLKRYFKGQQRDINLVRLYLQETTLADLIDVNRPSAVSLPALNGQRQTDHIANPRWPQQQTPSRSQVWLWKRYNFSSFLRYIPLWKTPPLSQTELSKLPIAPSNLEPKVTHTPTPASSFHTLKDYIKSLPMTQRQMLQSVNQKATDLQIWRAFRSKERLIIASDGGLNNQIGTFGWVISTRKTILFEGGGPVDGPFDTTSSTRCELCGFASALLLISAISRNWGLRHRCTFRWLTDNTAAALRRVIRMVRRGPSPRHLPPDSDILTLIRTLMWEIRRVITTKWG